LLHHSELADLERLVATEEGRFAPARHSAT
jgi:hypothetical protein